MEALNKKERNATIVRFALWFTLSVILISVPIILTTYLPKEQYSELKKEYNLIIQQIKYEQDTFAVEIQKIHLLLEDYKAKQINVNELRAKLTYITEGIGKRTKDQKDWRGTMYGNVLYVSSYLINTINDGDPCVEIIAEKDKVIAEKEKELAETNKAVGKAKLKLDKISNEFEKFKDDINRLKYSNLCGNNKSDVKNAQQKLEQLLLRLNQVPDDL